MAALMRRYEAEVLVTSQIPLARGDLLNLQKIDVPSPAMEIKAAIAEHASGKDAMAEDIGELLAAVSTGLEARPRGRSGRGCPSGAVAATACSMPMHENGWANWRGECICILSLVAAWLFDRLAFSMSIRDLDRLLDANGASAAVRRADGGSGTASVGGVTG